MEGNKLIIELRKWQGVVKGIKTFQPLVNLIDDVTDYISRSEDMREGIQRIVKDIENES